ncbi:DUF3253 domain-containing protein [Phenylobacterium sp.]|uniref:DUF3253 domain-containing protein n=1 Tax=Phenylobacterium sp. TaxID=1871053 RepID=UPI00179401AF|nr:DUF3253 domain-containing protein [Phenylobacterium sp.]MBA4793949.1 DUF3253 domain-containing protein [Phenylobacterium sp.]MBC7168836.1 DUF3253 domain-containing protein [Phenylobacterium sp.]
MADPIETVILDLLAPLAPGKSISPEEAARAADPEGWRRTLPKVRAVAVGMAREGRLVITRHGKPADPNQFKGVYRLRLPLEGEGAPEA